MTFISLVFNFKYFIYSVLCFSETKSINSIDFIGMQGATVFFVFNHT